MRSPLFSIINLHRCFIESIKLIRTEFGILSHSSVINCSNSLKFPGLRLSTFVLTMFQRFSIGLRSGLLEGQSKTIGTLFWRKSFAVCEVCLVRSELSPYRDNRGSVSDMNDRIG